MKKGKKELDVIHKSKEKSSHALPAAAKNFTLSESHALESAIKIVSLILGKMGREIDLYEADKKVKPDSIARAVELSKIVAIYRYVDQD